MSDLANLNAIPRTVHKREVVGTYDFSIHGGAIDTSGIEISDFFGINPGEAIRVAKIFCAAACTSDGSATVSIGTEASDPDNILDDTAVASLSLKAVLDGVPVPQTIATWIVNTGTTFLPIKVQVKVAALTAGKIDVYAEIAKLY
jgi:hypothetical protein